MKESDALRLERKIIIGMIIDTDFLKHVSEMIETQWMLSQEARLLATWIYDYHSKYRTAPKKKIQDIYFDKLANDKISEAQGEVIEDILEDLSNEVKDWDPEDIGYLQEQTKDYANYCKMLGITEEVQDLLDSGDLNDAKSVLTDFRPVEIIKISAVEPLKTDEQIKAAFAGRAVPLIKYPGDLGMLLNPHMVKQGFVVYLAQNKGGKALRNNHSPVLTNKGWKDISEMKVNDTIYNKHGKERKVTGVFPQGKNKCYRFIFNDGLYIDSDKEHIWTLQTYYQRYQKMNKGTKNKQYQKWINMPTKDIVKKYGIGKIKNGAYQPIFPRNESINFRKKKLEISPYVLGLLLGDGGFTGEYVGFTTDDYCLIEFIEEFGYQLIHHGGCSYRFRTKPENIKVKSHTDKNGKHTKGYTRSLQKVDFKYRTKTLLKKYGLWGNLSDTKFIPNNFLFNTKENRLEILKGLMDSDGDVDKRGHLAFNSTSKQLVNGVAFLIRSLGGRVTIKPRNTFYRKEGKKIYGKKSYRAFITINEIIFKIPRKIKRQRKFVRTKERILHEIQSIGEHETTCISTNDKDGLFITKDFIVTHNSFHLMDAGMRAAEQGRKVLMYQAGDMSQEQLELRMAIYATQISDQERYCGPLYIPIIDCQNNQLDSCEENCRVDPDQEALFEGGYNFFENDLTNSLLEETYDDNRSWKVCTECRSRSRIKHRRKFKGAVWFKKRSSVAPLDPYEYKRMRKRALKDRFYTPFKGFKNLRLGTHSSDTLTMGKVRAETEMLADKEGWKAEVVIADYLDLFGPDSKYAHLQFRDQENKKWAGGRRFSQDLDLLFISASQSDAQGFNKMLLDKTNFSEDRRKLDHVTAMIGINMTNEEKMMGLMRLNEVTTRETEGTYIVNVLHRLQIGRPILNSYF